MCVNNNILMCSLVERASFRQKRTLYTATDEEDETPTQYRRAVHLSFLGKFLCQSKRFSARLYNGLG